MKTLSFKKIQELCYLYSRLDFQHAVAAEYADADVDCCENRALMKRIQKIAGRVLKKLYGKSGLPEDEINEMISLAPDY